jgi:hypothetical protein
VVFFLVDNDRGHPGNEKKIKFRPNLLGSKAENKRWIISVLILTFFLSAFLQFASSKLLQTAGNLTALAVVFVIIFIGIVFDIIGIAVTAADETPFHAMASRKYYGAKQAIKLIRNANKVSSFCNDMIGDVCGIISGAAGTLIVVRVSQGLRATEAMLIGLSVSGMIASLTIGGKAIGKSIAIEKSNYITYKVSVVLQFLNRRKNSEAKNSRGKKRRK